MILKNGSGFPDNALTIRFKFSANAERRHSESTLGMPLFSARFNLCSCFRTANVSSLQMDRSFFLYLYSSVKQRSRFLGIASSYELTLILIFPFFKACVIALVICNAYNLIMSLKFGNIFFKINLTLT